MPPSRPIRRRKSRVAPKITPIQIVAVVAVLAAFLGGVVWGGAPGAAIVAALSIGAGALVVLRWPLLDPRIRVFRLVVSLVGLAVAVSLLAR